MTNNLLSDHDIEELMADEEGRKALVQTIRALNHGLFSVTVHGEPFWAYDRLRKAVKIVEPHLQRISDAKREEKRKK